MKLHELRPDKGSTRKRRRLGTGISAGQGKTAGRGMNGQGSRKGGTKGQYFEGGQLPLVRRLPFKRGFNNIFRINYEEVNVEVLEEKFEAGAVVTPEVLKAKGLIRDEHYPVVILGNGELKKNLTVHAHRFTKSAQEKIEKAGGSTTKIELLLTGARATIKKPTKEVLEALRAARKNG